MRVVLGTSLLVALVATGCGGSGPRHTVRLELTGLPVLAGDFHYRAWVQLGLELRSVGSFRVEADGRLVDLSGAEISGGRWSTSFDAAGATALVVSIEAPGAAGTAPSSTRILSGTFSGGVAALSVAGAEALGSDFTTATGRFILATPTNGDGTDETSGLWFLAFYDPNDPPSPGVFLPTLPAGWKYEGWAVIDGIPVSTGKFLRTDAADEAAPHSSTQPGPPFPGEDLLRDPPAGLTFPRDLSGARAMVTIEPEPDDSPQPFSLAPLSATIATPAQDHHVYMLVNEAAGFPSGRAVLEP